MTCHRANEGLLVLFLTTRCVWRHQSEGEDDEAAKNSEHSQAIHSGIASSRCLDGRLLGSALGRRLARVCIELDVTRDGEARD